MRARNACALSFCVRSGSGWRQSRTQSLLEEHTRVWVRDWDGVRPATRENTEDLRKLNFSHFNMTTGDERPNTTVIQVTNIAQSASLDQVRTLFSFLGEMEELKLFPE